MKDKDFSMDDLNLIKSLSLSEDKNDIFIQSINAFKNLIYNKQKYIEIKLNVKNFYWRRNTKRF